MVGLKLQSTKLMNIDLLISCFLCSRNPELNFKVALLSTSMLFYVSCVVLKDPLTVLGLCKSRYSVTTIELVAFPVFITCQKC